jgi:tetrahydromethanopterin S-methyltransferase subunit H
MLNFNKEQIKIQIGDVRIGGQPGENPIVMVGSVFYAKHAALLNEKTGEFDKILVEKEVNEFIEIVEECGMQAIIDVVGSYPEALIKECQYIAELSDKPFLVDGLNDSIRIPALEGLKEIGLLDRAILNSLDEVTSVNNLEKLKDLGIKNAILLTFGNRYIYSQQKLKLLKEKLLPNAEKANIQNILIDTAVLDLPSISINIEAAILIKEELGLPTGFAPSNAIYGWDFIKKYGDISRCGGITSIMAYCASSGIDFILFGPIKFAKCVVPSVALVAGINAYYRKRVLRKNISETSPLNYIF